VEPENREEPAGVPSQNLVRPGTLANCAGWAWAPPMIGFYRNAIEAARAHHRARRALVWECVALQHQLAVLRRSGTRRPRLAKHCHSTWAAFGQRAEISRFYRCFTV